MKERERAAFIMAFRLNIRWISTGTGSSRALNLTEESLAVFTWKNNNY